jgi:tetratricopeptide (TPR) repeat protein
MNEENWLQAIKYLEQALQIGRTQTEFNLAMGNCYMKLGRMKDAIHYFTVVVQYRSRNIAGWESLIRCLFSSALFEEASVQVAIAETKTGSKPLFIYYKAAIALALGKQKEGLLLLAEALHKAPKLLKKFIELNPVILQDQGVVDVIARARRK